MIGRSFILRLKLKFGDVIIIVLIIVSALLLTIHFYEGNTAAKTAVITQNNVVLKRIRLDNLSGTVTFDYGGKFPGTIEAANGSIRFAHAECPDQVCVKTGWISRPGQIAVCLPAGVMIKIEGNDSDIDIIVR